MKRVTGIGGIFFQSSDPVRLRTWYQRHLGIDVQEWGGAVFSWADAGIETEAESEANEACSGGSTIWSVGDAAKQQFAPGKASFMVNYRVADLVALVQVLKDEGCEVLEVVDQSEYGKFAWVLDVDGNKVELWEAPKGQ